MDVLSIHVLVELAVGPAFEPITVIVLEYDWERKIIHFVHLLILEGVIFVSYFVAHGMLRHDINVQNISQTMHY